jgi:pimeloyl-ACP methyl ester carboxylesterase
MPTLNRAGLCIDYTEAGAGPPVVLLHSSVAGNRQWRKLTALLSARHRVIAPNLHGYGDTSCVDADGPHTLPAAAQVVLQLCDGLALDGPLRVVGHSWGGAVALWLARTLGPRVTHLALYEPMLPGLLAGHDRAEAADTAAMHADVARLSAAGEWTALAQRFTDYFNGDGAWAASPPERQQAIANLLPPNPPEWDAAMVPVRAEVFAAISARTLLMCGGATRPALRAIATVLQQQFPHWALDVVPDCGHMAPLTHVDTINARLLRFLSTEDHAPSTPA